MFGLLGPSTVQARVRNVPAFPWVGRLVREMGYTVINETRYSERGQWITGSMSDEARKLFVQSTGSIPSKSNKVSMNASARVSRAGSIPSPASNSVSSSRLIVEFEIFIFGKQKRFE